MRVIMSKFSLEAKVSWVCHSSIHPYIEKPTAKHAMSRFWVMDARVPTIGPPESERRPQTEETEKSPYGGSVAEGGFGGRVERREEGHQGLCRPEQGKCAEDETEGMCHLVSVQIAPVHTKKGGTTSREPARVSQSLKPSLSSD